MNAQLNQNSHDLLKNFIPLNTLPSARYTEICHECLVEECAKGTILFEQGDDAKEFIYLISGMIGLYAGEMEMETIVTGSEAARFAIAHHIPRKVKAVTKSKARIVRIPTHMLDMERPEDKGQTYMVDEVEDQGGDWMTTMLQSPVFQRLPASNLQKVMMQMEEVAFQAGEVVVKQGDEADYYYIIKSGDCELIRQPSEGARPVKLAELHSCDAFGEDALLSGNPRNVTVKMKGKGQMLRLSKANFISLVKEPVLQYVSFEDGQQKVDAGANWLDVRSVDAYVDSHIEGSINIPFFSLRMKVAELKHDQLQVLVCEKGRTSEAAAFLLLKFGFNAVILKAGMNGLQKQKAKPHATASPAKAPTQPLEVVNIAQSGDETAVANEVKQQDDGLLTAAQNKIIELEKFSAQLNEKLNTLELERNNLQQQNEEKSVLVSELQASSQVVADELEAKRADEITKGDESSQELLSEREKNASLTAELEELTVELRSIEEQKDIAGKDLEDQLATAKQEMAELREQEAVLRRDAEEAKTVHEEGLRSKSQIEEQLKQSNSDSLEKVSEKEEQLQTLNSQIVDMAASLKGAEEMSDGLQKSLEERSYELKQAQEAEVGFINQQKLEAESQKGEFDVEMGTLNHQLAEKVSKLAVNEARISALEKERDLLSESEQSKERLIQEKQADIDSFSHQLNESGVQLVALKEQKDNLEAVVLKSDEELAGFIDELSNVKIERDELREKLDDSGSGLSKVLAEKEQLNEKLSLSINSVNEFEERVQASEAEIIELKERNEEVLTESSNNLEMVEVDLHKVELEVEGLREKVANAESLLSAATSGKEMLENELTQRLADIEHDLSESAIKNTELENKLDEAQRSAEEKSAELKGSLEQALNESAEQLIRFETELKEAQQGKQGIEAALQHSESGKEALEDELKQRLLNAERALEDEVTRSAELEKNLGEEKSQAEDERTKLEASLQEEKSRVGLAEQALSDHSQRVQSDVSESAQKEMQLEATLKEVQQNKSDVEQALQNAEPEKGALQNELVQLKSKVESDSLEQGKLSKQLIEAQQGASEVTKEHESDRAQLAELLQQEKVSFGEKEDALLAQLEEAKLELTAQQAVLEVKQRDMGSSQAEFGKNVSTLEGKLEASRVETESSQQRCEVLESQLSALSSSQQTEEGELKQQVFDLESKLQAAQESILLKENAAGVVTAELVALEQSQLSNEGALSEAQQKVEELEQSLKKAEEVKAQLAVSESDTHNVQLEELNEQLLVAEDKAKHALEKASESLDAKELSEKEVSALNEELATSSQLNKDLNGRISSMKKSAPKDAHADEVRIAELEQQLDDSNSALMDLEIKMETSAVEIDEGPTEEEKSALKALESELNLVREQTEKDILAMQVKVENSEKMNLALKKKILSMQTLANQEIVEEETPKEKKKGWWK
ncbi:MAG: hypothetical protein A6F70_02725 [Cycloclasticus sp. symbiont of Bathymodiolus heckerae]|nr:MAG: hypothetical protein A6F70_02725 [Cycloclasticus sp. symbiont of Bathymodiolus heckerae]